MKRRLFLAAMALVLAGCASTSTTPNQVDTQQLLSDVIDLAIKVQANQSASIPTPIPPAPVPVPVPLPTPEPVPVPPVPVQPVQAQITVWDADKIPDMMRQAFPAVAGFTDNQLFWTLFDSSCYGTHDGGFALGFEVLRDNAKGIGDWFRKRVEDIGNQLKANKSSTITIIVNDSHDGNGEEDRGGLYIWPSVESQLIKMGVDMSQVKRGTWWDGKQLIYN